MWSDVLCGVHAAERSVVSLVREGQVHEEAGRYLNRWVHSCTHAVMQRDREIEGGDGE